MANTEDVKNPGRGVLLSLGDRVEELRRKGVPKLEQRVMAFLYGGDGSFDMAAARELKSIDPENPVAMVGSSLTHYLAGDYVAAVRCADDAIRANPLSRDAVMLKLYYIHALSDRGLYSFVEADAFANQALENFRGDADVLEHLIVVAAETFNSASLAREVYSAGVELDRARFDTWDSYIKQLVSKLDLCDDD